MELKKDNQLNLRIKLNIETSDAVNSIKRMLSCARETVKDFKRSQSAFNLKSFSTKYQKLY